MPGQMRATRALRPTQPPKDFVIFICAVAVTSKRHYVPLTDINARVKWPIGWVGAGPKRCRCGVVRPRAHPGCLPRPRPHPRTAQRRGSRSTPRRPNPPPPSQTPRLAFSRARLGPLRNRCRIGRRAIVWSCGPSRSDRAARTERKACCWTNYYILLPTQTYIDLLTSDLVLSAE